MSQGNNRAWKEQLLQNSRKEEQQRALVKCTEERIIAAYVQSHGQERAKSKFVLWNILLAILQGVKLEASMTCSGRCHLPCSRCNGVQLLIIYFYNYLTHSSQYFLLHIDSHMIGSSYTERIQLQWLFIFLSVMTAIGWVQPKPNIRTAGLLLRKQSSLLRSMKDKVALKLPFTQHPPWM
jgi:hypothetical protein